MANSNHQGRPTEVRSDDDTRIEDYVNDKLQTHADLEGLDILLENVRIQQDLLKRQLSEAEQASRSALVDATQHAREYEQKSRVFGDRSNKIEQRIQAITETSSSNNAVRQFEPILNRLDNLDLAAEVVHHLEEMKRLSTKALQDSRSTPREALKPYLHIREISTSLKQTETLSQDAAPDLVNWAEAAALKIWLQMREAYELDFEKTLKKIEWPSKNINMADNLAQEWADGVDRLLELQEPELKTAEEPQPGLRKATPLPLLPLSVMVKPLELGFKYHFEGDKPTNRLDKPEYFLSHVVSLFNTYDGFFLAYLQPILSRRFRDTSLSLNPVYVDSTSALITALLPMLRQKLASFIPRVSGQPQLFSHLIHELMSFDEGLRNDWSYTGGSVAEDWKGLTWEVLVAGGWFPRWLQVEKDFALERYNSIVSAADSGDIDFDSADPGITKPTKAAIRVNDLLETITDRYRNLSSFSQKLHFLIDIQISIFDQFHGRLHDSLEAYLTMNSSLARTMQSVSKEEQAQLHGVAGLDRLCRVYGSAEYLERKMQDWSEDVFFVELWDELQFRASNGGQIGGDLTVAQVAPRTSSSIGGDDSTGGLFDETSSAYRRLRERSEGILIETSGQSMREALRSYGRSSSWSSLSGSDDVDAAEIAPSSELDAAIDILNTTLAFLARVLSDSALRRIARQVASIIQTYIWDNVLLRHRFAPGGSRQLQRDLAALEGVLDQRVAAGQGRAGLRRLFEATVLLSLPESDTANEEDAWEMDETPTERPLSLKEVETRVYRDNEGAREALEALGLQALSEGDARNVLGRRLGSTA